MESPGNASSARKRIGATTTTTAAPYRSHSNSSTSSDILVAPAPPAVTTIPNPNLNSASLDLMPLASMMNPTKRIAADVRDGRLLVVSAQEEAGVNVMKNLLERLKRDDVTTTPLPPSHVVKHELVDDNQHGPNHRGTYSKAYTLQHPEIKWVHRGQGRYLPASAAQTPSSQSQFQSQSKDQLKDSIQSLDNNLKGRSLRTSLPQRRSSWAGQEDPKEKVPSLRTRLTDAQANADDSELRSARFGRRAKPAQPNDTERRSSRISTTLNYNDESEDDEEDSDMAGDKDPTYDREYVEAHPDETFYHTGNGWYKRGRRPRGRKNAKLREAEGHAVKRGSDGSYQFNPNTTIHVSQLELYPGVEFHHCGNGWYRAGPDASGHRASRYGADDFPTEEDEDGEGEDEAADDGEEEDVEQEEPAEDINRAVSKEYTLRHPEIEWVHRGKGRYKRKDVVQALNASTPASNKFVPPERDQTIYSKAHVEAHPDQVFHHRGNARYMRGPPPEHWASVRRKKSSQALEPQQPDDGVLYSKEYVESRPDLVFHHRGQGRYALGPRKLPSENSVDADAELVDTEHVDSHPWETFHHRGQGRWARGMPPPGSSKKVAIRGPGALEKTEGDEGEEEDEANKPPPLTALVLKAEGPDKWPNLNWNYRGGGKWGRLTKQEVEDRVRGNVPRKPKGKGRMGRMDGPEAQIAREAAAAERGGFGAEVGADGLERPRIKRRRMGKRGAFFAQDDGTGTKASSISQSQAPTPKPRMLEPEEDVITEEDLPQLYRDEWSPPSEDLEGQTDRVQLYRPMNPPEKFLKGLTKHDPATRPLDNLKRLAANAQTALEQIQAEYLKLDKITAPHARIPRRPAKGGRVPIDPQVFEDKKEADLYDYNYDPRRLGYQDPQAQKIQRDADGRELRNRRHRSGVTNGTLPGWNFGDDEPLGPRRAVKPVNRFDGVVDVPRKRARNSAATSKAGSMTPDRAATPLGGPVKAGLGTATRGRLIGNIPKRIRELRDESVGGGGKREGSPGGSSARKGRPPGSKNLHKRRDAGIKKGPRKPKVVDSIESPFGSEAEGEF